MFKHRARIRALRAAGCTVTLHRWYSGGNKWGIYNTVGLTVVSPQGDLMPPITLLRY